MLEFLDHLLLRFCSFLRKVCDLTDLLGLVFVLIVELCIVLSELSESFTRGRFNLERLNFLKNVGTVHSLDDRINISE